MRAASYEVRPTQIERFGSFTFNRVSMTNNGIVHLYATDGNVYSTGFEGEEKKQFRKLINSIRIKPQKSPQSRKFPGQVPSPIDDLGNKLAHNERKEYSMIVYDPRRVALVVV